jgi:hypothetical protein
MAWSLRQKDASLITHFKMFCRDRSEAQARVQPPSSSRTSTLGVFIKLRNFGERAQLNGHRCRIDFFRRRCYMSAFGIGSSRNAARSRRRTSRNQCLPAPATYQNGRDSSTPQSAVSNYSEWHGSGVMPKLSIDPNDLVTKRLDSIVRRISLSHDRFDGLPVSILPDPKRTFGPREPRIATLPWTGWRAMHNPIRSVPSHVSRIWCNESVCRSHNIRAGRARELLIQHQGLLKANEAGWSGHLLE